MTHAAEQSCSSPGSVDNTSNRARPVRQRFWRCVALEGVRREHARHPPHHRAKRGHDGITVCEPRALRAQGGMPNKVRPVRQHNDDVRSGAERQLSGLRASATPTSSAYLLSLLTMLAVCYVHAVYAHAHATRARPVA